jgi:hypothetical protein
MISKHLTFGIIRKKYQIDFNGFRQKIYRLFDVNGTIESFAKLESIITLNNVIQRIRKSRQPKDNKTLFIFLHIDEIQEMLEYDRYWTREKN